MQLRWDHMWGGAASCFLWPKKRTVDLAIAQIQWAGKQSSLPDFSGYLLRYSTTWSSVPSLFPTQLALSLSKVLRTVYLGFYFWSKLFCFVPSSPNNRLYLAPSFLLWIMEEEKMSISTEKETVWRKLGGWVCFLSPVPYSSLCSCSLPALIFPAKAVILGAFP